MKLRWYIFKKRVMRVAVIIILAVTTASAGGSRSATVLDTVHAENVLRMITFVGPTTYFTNNKGPSGFEFRLAKAFADHLGVRLEITFIDDLDAIFNAVGGPRGHFAGAGLTVTEGRETRVRFSRPYNSVKQTLVYRRSTKKPKSIADVIGGNLVVVANSSHHERLRQLSAAYPALQWQALRDTEMLELMQLVHLGQADYAVVDSTAFAIDRSIYPKARAAFDLTDEQDIAWAFPKHSDNTLLKAANRFLGIYQENGHLKRLKDRFFGHIDEFSVSNSLVFMERIHHRLGKYEDIFKNIAQTFHMDWRLLAAMAYQESHWNPRAVSPTGVRGMMMLTRQTAAELNIENRLDVEQSIRGGAEYFQNIHQRIPDDIAEPDRTWFALAAYNVGLGHLEDARVLTERHGDDPHLWHDVSRYLPLLQQRKYYRTLKYGFARGREPVQYVQNIRHYRTVLQWYATHRQNPSDETERSYQIFNGDLALPL